MNEEWRTQVVLCFTDAFFFNCLDFIVSSVLLLLQTHICTDSPLTYSPVFSSHPTAQREIKSRLIQALSRGHQIPAQAWQTRSKFSKPSTTQEPSPCILCVSSNTHLLSCLLICMPLNSTEIYLYPSPLCQNTSAHSQALWAHKHTSGESNLARNTGVQKKKAQLEIN